MLPNETTHQHTARSGAQRNVRRPFDTGEMERIPRATEQDPPYRPWWVVDVPSCDKADLPA